MEKQPSKFRADGSSRARLIGVRVEEPSWGAHVRRCRCWTLDSGRWSDDACVNSRHRRCSIVHASESRESYSEAMPSPIIRRVCSCAATHQSLDSESEAEAEAGAEAGTLSRAGGRPLRWMEHT
jgi:hypothetical protein